VIIVYQILLIVSTLTCLEKPDPCYIFKYLHQSWFNINTFSYRELPFNQHLIALVTLREKLRTEYQPNELRFSCATHSRHNCAVIQAHYSNETATSVTIF